VQKSGATSQNRAQLRTFSQLRRVSLISVIQPEPRQLPRPAFVIREATREEFATIGDVTVAAFASGPYGHLPTSAERARLLRDAEGRAASGNLLVAVASGTGTQPEGTVIGTASLLRAETEHSRLATGEEFELRLLGVLPEARGLGLGEALTRVALERAVEQGASALVLDTGELNLPAQRLYERLGFELISDAAQTADVPLVAYRYPLQRPDGEVLVRLMRDDEVDAVAELSERAYAHDYSLSDSYRASIVDVAGRAGEHQVWVASDTETGALLGTVSTPRAGAVMTELPQVGEMDFRLLAVHPDARRRGIGELLSRHVLLLGRLRGVPRVVMNSGPEMTGAHALYERLGFERLLDREPLLTMPDGRELKLLSFGYSI
jgi:ribosomal protein S18 acetylase RimI-like enzyme